MTHTSGDPLVGRTIAHYEILTRLGGGGMGVVYKAVDRKLGRAVALKFLPPQWSNDQAARERFVREAQAASATHHPNICTIHDVETTDEGQLFIVMAYYEGQTLKDRLANGPLPVDEALDIATQVADGLARAHAQGVVHRDIKPGNLILTEDGVRIVDFGLATLVDALQITVQGSTLGTAAYMSPEQARGEEVDARTDVWALGTVLYEMLAGRVPFRGTYAEAIAYAIRHDPPPPLRPLRPEVREEVEQLVFRALHKDPSVRFASGREFARALRQVRGLTLPMDLRTEVVVPPPASTAPRRRQYVRALLPALLTTAVIATGAAAWALWPLPRTRVVIAPVSNLTRSDQLNRYQLALTQLAILELRDSRDIQVLPYERLLPLMRRYIGTGPVLPAADVLQAIAEHTSADVVLVPILEYEDGLWRARAERRDALARPLPGDDLVTTPIKSAIPEDAAARLVVQLASAIEQRYASRRSQWLATIAGVFGGRRAMRPVIGSLDAGLALEEGVNWYDAGEYHAAAQAFLRAAELDGQNALPLAWASRTALLMRQDEAAVDRARRALVLLTGDTQRPVRLFVEAVAAEAQRDFETASARYEDLADAYADEPWWQMERALFDLRREAPLEALAAFGAAAEADPQLLQANVETCRVDNLQGEFAAARQHAERALADYTRVGDYAGQVQALFCLTDSLIFLGGDALADAQRHADEALSLARKHGLVYNVARAHNYVGKVAGARGDMDAAAAAFTAALTGAQAVGNRPLEALQLMNLGVAHEALGHPAQAFAHFADAYERYMKLSNERRAAQIQANIGMLFIEYGMDPEEGLRRLENALGIIGENNSRDFEVFGAQIRAEYLRYSGRLQQAVAELNRALVLASERKLRDEIAVTQTALAQARFDSGEYGPARDLLVQAAEHASPRDRTYALLRLAETEVRLGDLASAASHAAEAREDLAPRGEDGLFPLLYAVEAELALARGAVADARLRYGQAAAFWTSDGFPDEPSVAARGAAGLLAGLAGQTRDGIAALDACVAQAEKMHRFLLAARCRADGARLALQRGEVDEAWRRLGEIPDDSADRQVGPELRAIIHYRRAETLARRGDAPGAEREYAAAKRLVQDVRDRLPERYRNQFANRVDIRPMLNTPADVPIAPSSPR